MGMADASGTNIAINTAPASRHESKLVEDTLNARHNSTLPERLIGDKAYDSDGLDADLAKLGVEKIAPHRENRKKAKTQDGRSKRRWKVERLFAHLQNFRRLVVRYEYYAQNFLALVQLGCIKLLLRLF
jgi:transposase